MTKAQLIKENQELRAALRIVCTEPGSDKAIYIRIIQRHLKYQEEMIWNGTPQKVENKFSGFINQCDKTASGGSVI